MERRWLSILIITFVLFITFEVLYSSKNNVAKSKEAASDSKISKQEEKSNTAKSDETVAGKADNVGEKEQVSDKESQEAKVKLTERIVEVDGDDFVAKFTTIGGRLKSYKLTDYLDMQNKTVELVNSKDMASYPLDFRLEGGEVPLDYMREYKVKAGKPGSIDFEWRSNKGIEIRKNFEIDSKGNLFGFRVILKNLSNDEKKLGTPVVTVSGFRNFESHGGGCASGCTHGSDGRKMVEMASPKFLVDDDYIEALTDKDIMELKPVQGHVKWLGIDRHYFMLALVTKDASEQAIVSYHMRPDRMLIGEVRLPEVVLGPGQEKIFNFQVFAGPKYRDLLKEAGADLDRSIDFGWFWFLAIPMLLLMQFFYSIVGNYGIAIIFLTIVVKIILLPITQKMYRSMNRMKKIQPLIKELKERYGDDKEGFQKAQMELMKREGVNPLGGCLPMFIQMPVYIALWRALFSAVELYQAPMGLWIHDLSAPDPYYVLPIFLVITMVISQRMTPTTGDDVQAKMMQWMMPIVFGFMMFMLPSGLVLYILANSLLQIVHQAIMMKLPEPEIGPAKEGLFYRLMNKVQESSEQMQRMKDMEEAARRRREERAKRIAEKRRKKKGR